MRQRFETLRDLNEHLMKTKSSENAVAQQRIRNICRVVASLKLYFID